MRKCLISYISMLYATQICFIVAVIMIANHMPEMSYRIFLWISLGLCGGSVLLGFLAVLWAVWLMVNPNRLDLNRLNYKIVMIAKLTMIPWFICNFFQCGLLVAGFLNPFLMLALIIVLPLLILMTYMAILPASVASTALGVAHIRRKQGGLKGMMIWQVFEYVFVLDVIASVVLYVKCYKKENEEKTTDSKLTD